MYKSDNKQVKMNQKERKYRENCTECPNKKQKQNIFIKNFKKAIDKTVLL